MRIKIHLAEAPVEDHQANGFIEVAVREMKRQIRAMLSDFQERLGHDVEPSHPCMTWLPRHAAYLLTRLQSREPGEVRVDLPVVVGPLTRPPVDEVIPRNLYVTKADIDKFGRTPFCPGCEAHLLETGRRAHNAECRFRIEGELMKTEEGKKRIESAKARIEAGRRPKAPRVGGGAGDVEVVEAANVPALVGGPEPDAEMASGEAVGEPLERAQLLIQEEQWLKLDHCQLLEAVTLNQKDHQSKRLAEGKKHLRTSVRAYRKQMDEGARSWEEPDIKELRNDPRVYEVTGPMCRWKMESEDAWGKGLVKKETRSGSILYEPDPRHAEILLKDLGMETCKPAKSAGWSTWLAVNRAAYLKPEDPNAQETLEALRYFRDGPLQLTSEQLRDVLRASPKALQKPQAAYQAARQTAPEEFQSPEAFRELVLRCPMVLELSFNCGHSCAAACNRCWCPAMNRIKQTVAGR
eukprot:s775_g7.t1